MFARSQKSRWLKFLLAFVAFGVTGPRLGGRLLPASPGRQQTAVLHKDDIKKVQETLRDKGYYSGPIDGIMGPRSRAALRQYQKSENLPVTGHFDTKTADKLGVGPESVGENFEGAGKAVAQGSKGMGHEIKKGKPVAAGKEFGKGLGRGGKKVGKAVKEAVSPKSE